MTVVDTMLDRAVNAAAGGLDCVGNQLNFFCPLRQRKEGIKEGCLQFIN